VPNSASTDTGGAAGHAADRVWESLPSPRQSAWREHVLARAGELRALLNWLCEAHGGSEKPSKRAKDLRQAITGHLQAAKEAAEAPLWRHPLSSVDGALVERAVANLDAADCHLLLLALEDREEEYFTAQLPRVLAHTRVHLAEKNPHREAIEKLVAEAPAKLLARQKLELINAHQAALANGRKELKRVRSFRNLLYVAAAVLAVATVALAVLGWVAPRSLPMCFAPSDMVVCPTSESPIAETSGAADQGGGDQSAGGTTAAGGSTDGAAPGNPARAEAIRRAAGRSDVMIVALLGLVAGAIAAAVAIRNIKGTNTPFGVPVALAVLKLPTGAVTAVVAVLLTRGGFVPGLSALDSSAQILAWAIVFGYAQQIFTTLVDRQGQIVLEGVAGGSTAEIPPRPTA
jgi:hypothetical protein